MSNNPILRKRDLSNTGKSYDIDSIIRDVLRQWWVILLASLMAALTLYGAERITYTPQYQTSSTFIVGKNGVSANSVSDNLSAASILTSSFDTIVNSDIMNERICEALNTDSFHGSIMVNNVQSTNLVTLYVTSDSPETAYLAINTVMDTAVDLGGEISDNITLQVLEAPSVPVGTINPFSPKRHMELAALAMALLMVLLFVAISYNRDSVKNELEMQEKIDAKMLGSVYHERKYRSFVRLLKKEHYSLSIENPTCSFRYIEGIRLISTRIRHALDKQQAKVILVTSSLENEGKSTFAANLAMSLNHEGNRTLLIDCDFRKPAQYKIFGMKAEDLTGKDLAASIEEKSSVWIKKVGMEKNLSCLFTVKASEHMIFGQNKEYMAKVLEIMKEQYNYIVIDSSPIGMVAEVEELASLCDAGLMIVQQDMTEAGFINDMIDVLNRTSAKVTGCVFNNVREGLVSRFSDYNTGYGDYKSSYHHYGHYGSYGNYGSYGQYGRYGKYGKYGKYEEQEKLSAKNFEYTHQADAGDEGIQITIDYKGEE